MTSIYFRPDSIRSQEVVRHCEKVLAMWGEIYRCQDIRSPIYQETFHNLLDEISSFFSRNKPPLQDQKLSHDYLSDLADLLLGASFGTVSKDQLNHFLKTRWLDQLMTCEGAINISLAHCNQELSDNPTLEEDRRAKDRRSSGRCRRVCNRPYVAVERRVSDRRTMMDRRLQVTQQI